MSFIRFQGKSIFIFMPPISMEIGTKYCSSVSQEQCTVFNHGELAPSFGKKKKIMDIHHSPSVTGLSMVRGLILVRVLMETEPIPGTSGNTLRMGCQSSPHN